MRRYCYIVGMVLTAACAAEYKPINGGGSGYSDQKIAKNHYMIQVYGYSTTPHQQLEQYFHRRAGELCENTPYHFQLKQGEMGRMQLPLLIPVKGGGFIAMGNSGIPGPVPGASMVGGAIKCQESCVAAPAQWYLACI